MIVYTGYVFDRIGARFLNLMNIATRRDVSEEERINMFVDFAERLDAELSEFVRQVSITVADATDLLATQEDARGVGLR